MPIYIDDHLGSPTVPLDSLTQVHGFVFNQFAAAVPSGSLRFGGDSPNGLVLVNNTPSARIVDVFTRDTINGTPVLLHVLRTMSAVDGTYNLTGLAARTEGYDVCLRGVVASGERDYWIPGVHPG